jgi:hydrogenase maturation protease
VTARILVAGIGNVLFGDDGFGVAVVQRLGALPLPPGVEILNAGVRGFDLTQALLDGGYEGAILIDAARRGRTPGTLYVLEPTVRAGPGELDLDSLLDPHGLEPSRVLMLAQHTGANLRWLRLVACEPSAELELTMSLSPEVDAAVEPAVELVLGLLRRPNGRHPAHA